jgi:predicted RND superfamily exporter protein
MAINITGISVIADGLQYAFGDAIGILMVIGLALLLLLFLVGFNMWIAPLFLAIPILIAATLNIGLPKSVAGFAILILAFASAIAFNRIMQGQR